MQRSLDAGSQPSTHDAHPRHTTQDPPHEFPVRRTHVEAQVAPAAAHVVAARVGAVETKQEERIFHHVLGLERDRQPRVLVRDLLGGERCVEPVRTLGEDDSRLWFLQSQYNDRVKRFTWEIRSRGLTHLAESTLQLLVKSSKT